MEGGNGETDETSALDCRGTDTADRTSKFRDHDLEESSERPWNDECNERGNGDEAGVLDSWDRNQHQPYCEDIERANLDPGR